MTPEGKVKEEIKAYLDSLGAYYFMPVQQGYGRQSVDFLCCIRGRFVAIEAKAPGKLPSPRQDIILGAVHRSGGLAFYTDNLVRCQRYIQDHALGEYNPDVG